MTPTLEALIHWKSLDEEERQLFAEGLRADNMEKFIGLWSPELPSDIVFTFPLSLIQPNHPGMGQIKLHIPCKSTGVNTTDAPQNSAT